MSLKKLASLLLASACWTYVAGYACGQGAVQVPPGTAGSGTFGSPPTTFGTPPIGPPPTFDPYAGSTFGTPPPSVPYSYSTPAPTTTSPWQQYPPAPSTPGYPTQQGTTLPFDWQQGSYSFQGQNAYVTQAQKFVQDLGLEYTWLYGDGGANQLGINRIEAYSTFTFPVPYSIETPLLVTPGFAVNFLQGPVGMAALPPADSGPELPPRLYDAYLDFAWFPQFNEFLGAELGFRTGVWSDFDHVDADSVRFLGRGLAKVSLNPQLDILFGAVYLDRLRIKLLPAGGVYWRPTPDWDLYLVFPNPKVRRHFQTVGTLDWYWFVAGEYGGGSWSVDRSGIPGRVDINDIRVSTGFEWETPSQIRGHIEVGYVFDREVIFDDATNTPTFKPDDTVMVRGGIDF